MAAGDGHRLGRPPRVRMDHTAAEETDDEESVAESPGPDDRRGGGGGDAAAAAETYALVGRRATVTRTRSGRTIAEERDSQRQLLLLALLEQFVASYEKDPNRSRTLYLQICKQLVRSGLIDPEHLIDDTLLLKYAASQLFGAVLNQAIREIDNESATKRNMLAASSSHELALRPPLLPASPRRSSASTSSTGVASRSTASTTSLSAATPLPSGGQISRYLQDFEEIRPIGHGGFGRVMEAHNKLDGRAYAIKQIPMRVTSEGSFSRILREVRLFARLEHPAVVRYYSAWIEVHQNPPAASAPAGDASEGSAPRGPVVRIRNLSEALDDEAAFASGGSGDASPTKGGRSAGGAHGDASDDAYSEEGDEEDDAEDVSTPGGREGPGDGAHTLRMTLYIQMELCEETLSSWLEARNQRVLAGPGSAGLSSADVSEALGIFRDIVAGVQYLHSQKLIHRDIKPQNIFFQKPGNVPKIGDFGLSRSFALGDVVLDDADSSFVAETPDPTRSPSRPNTTGVGTSSYGAPEQLESGRYGQAVDIYALGIILFELLYPMGTGMERAITFRDLRNGLLPKEFLSVWPVEASVILALTSHDPDARPTATEVLQLDLLKGSTAAPSRNPSDGSELRSARATPLPPVPSPGAAAALSGGASGAVLATAVAAAPLDPEDVAAALAAKDREIEELRRQLQEHKLLLTMMQAE